MNWKDCPNDTLESVERWNPFDVYGMEGRLVQPELGSSSPETVADRDVVISEPIRNPRGTQSGEEIDTTLSRATSRRARPADSRNVGSSNTLEVRGGSSSTSTEDKPRSRMPGNDGGPAVGSSYRKTSQDVSVTGSGARLRIAIPSHSNLRNEEEDIEGNASGHPTMVMLDDCSGTNA